MMEQELTYTSTVEVCEENTALGMGSGELPVFATPALVALMENAAMKLAASYVNDAEKTTVGGRIDVTHLLPSPLGALIRAVATLVEVKGKKLSFTIEAFQGDTLVGKASHIRFVVGRKEFMERLS